MNFPLIVIAAFVFFTLLVILLAWRQKRSTVWHWLLLIGGPLLVIAVAGVLEVSRQNRALAPFQPYLDEYLYLPGENAGNTVLQMTFAHPTDSPYIRGKIVPVQVRDNTLDVLYFDLPAELRADSPDEVGTVVWLYCTSVTQVVRRVGASTSNTVDYSCDVAVIDRSIPAIVATHSFRETAGEQGYRDVLYPDIVEYLAGIPRR